jgi:L-fuconolactonase
MLGIAERTAFVVGVVGWVPLMRPKEAAEALDRFAKLQAFKGVRHLIHDEPDPDWLLQETVREGLRLVGERGMTLDVPAELPRHLEHIATLAVQLPELKIVVDHLGKPPIRDKRWEPWATLLARAAERPNVYAKLSGLDTAADRRSWTADDLRPYVRHALRCFGAERLMFGSDWPVSTLAGGYGKVWCEMSRLFGELDEPDRRAILSETAISLYRLEL